MQQPDKLQPQKKLPIQEIDYFKIGKIIFSRWYWIAGAILLCVLYAYTYLWYTPKTYATSGILKFEEKKSEISDLVTVISTSDRGPSKLQSESFVLQSRNLLLNAIRKLDYRVSFYLAGRVRTSDIYPQKPLDIELLKFDSLNYFNQLITFKYVDNKSYSLSWGSGRKGVTKNFLYNEPATLGNTSFSIRYPGIMSRNTTYMFKFNTPEAFLGRVRGGLRTSEIVKNSNIITLQETDLNPQFAADVLNAIMTEYLDYDRDQKTKSATQMIHFIDNQLQFLSSEVKGSEQTLKNYKQRSGVIDVTTSTTMALGKASELESQRSLANLQLMAIDQLKKQIAGEKDNVNLNLNVEGTVDPLLAGLLTSLNNLLVERTALLKTYNTTAQPVQDINRQILQIKNAVLQNVSAWSQRIQSNINYINRQLSQANQQISALPAAERDLVSIRRDFEINEKVYSFLSEKKLEAQISRSAILPGASIIEPAQVNENPISPNEHEIYRTAIIIGLVLGFGIIILIRVLNPYIYDKETVESLTTVPIIGVIRKFPEKLDEDNSQILALSKPRSIFAESVRAVRTNLSFIASEKESKVICITSEVAGEGKSFVAVNLSSTLSLIDKKVILIGADLRRSRLHKVFNTPNDVGLSNYLANQCELDDIIHHTPHEGLHFISSGPVPPNPSELLHTPRMMQLIEELKQWYHFVMIDTAPIGLVSDSIPLIRASDINLFVIRSGKSKYYAATVPQRVANEYNLDNTVIVLNAFEEDLLHSRYYTTKINGEDYGTRYYYYSDYRGYESSGYYIDDQKRKWWDIRRWF